jgi:hypothetical protein
MKKLVLSLSVVYESLEESSVFRRAKRFQFGFILLELLCLSIQFFFIKI